MANVDGRAALIDSDNFYDLHTISDGTIGPDPMDAIAKFDRLSDLGATLGDHKPSGKLAGALLGAPVPRPQKSFGIGLNYQNHATESAMELPTSPMVFAKLSNCICGPTATVELRSDGCDYEGELVVVIGTGGRDIAPADAWNHVLGLTIGQDISDRPAQFLSKPPQFNLGKSFDTFGPTGPFLVSLDQIPDPCDLAIKTMINGELRQDDTTASLIFDVPTLISFLSSITTLEPGDLIFTGTPEGVGFAQDKFLKDGDVITTTIEGLGTMVNPCVRLADWN